MLKALAITMALSGATTAPTVPVVPYPHTQQPAPTATPNEQKLDDALKDLDAALADLERAVKERQAREQLAAPK